MFVAITFTVFKRRKRVRQRKYRLFLNMFIYPCKQFDGFIVRRVRWVDDFCDQMFNFWMIGLDKGGWFQVFGIYRLRGFP